MRQKEGKTMILKEKRKIFAIMAIIFIVCIAIFIGILSTVDNAEAVSGDPVVSLKPSDKSTGVSHSLLGASLAIPKNNADYLYVDIYISSGTITDPIVVYYKTRDISASSSLGDYEPIMGSQTISADRPSATIGIKVNSSKVNVDFTAKNATTVSSNPNATDDKTTNYNIFEFVIYKIESSDPSAQVDNVKYKQYCAINSAAKKMTAAGNNSYLAAYSLQYKKSFEFDMNGDDKEQTKTYSLDNTYLALFQYLYQNGYASTYASANGYLQIDENGWYTFWTTADTYKLAIRNYNQTTNLLYTKGKESDEDKKDFTRIGNYTELYDKEHSQSGTCYQFSNYSSNADKKGYFVKLNESTANSVSIYFSKSGGTDIDLRDWDVYIRLIDNTKPKVTNWSVDNKAVMIGEPLRICVRFSEPVNVGVTPSLTAKLEGTGDFADKTATFTYASGIGTDTLVFEFVPNRTFVGTITGLEVTSFNNSNSIKDFAAYTQTTNKADITQAQNSLDSVGNLPMFSFGASNNDMITCSGYFRDESGNKTDDFSNQRLKVTPVSYCSNELIVDSSTDGCMDANNSYDINITTEIDIASAHSKFFLSYIWDQSSSQPDSYTDYIPNATTSYICERRNGNIATMVGAYTIFNINTTRDPEQRTGSYFLHIKVATSFGIEKKMTYGPFLFDNTSPGITDLTLVSTSLTETKFSLSVDDKPAFEQVKTLELCYSVNNPYSSKNDFQYNKKPIYSPDITEYISSVNGVISSIDSETSAFNITLLPTLFGLADYVPFNRETDMFNEQAAYFYIDKVYKMSMDPFDSEKVYYEYDEGTSSYIEKDLTPSTYAVNTYYTLEDDYVRFTGYAIEDMDENIQYYSLSEAAATFYLGFLASDFAGNQSDIIWYKTTISFDTRNTVTYSVSVFKEDDSTVVNPVFVDDSIKVYDTTNVIHFVYSMDTDEEIKNNTTLFVESLVYQDKQLDVVKNNEGTSFNCYYNEEILFSGLIDEVLDKVTLIVNSQDLKGYVGISFKILQELTGESMFTTTDKFFLTKESADVNGCIYGSDETNNYNVIKYGGALLNKVYQVPSYRYYYRDYSTTNAGNIKTGIYNSTTNLQLFSSREKAIEYLFGYELYDIYAEKLNAVTASYLNNGTNNYIKANNETNIAQAGDIWIKYKITAKPVTATAASNWVYYYYGKDYTNGSIVSVDPNNFSELLQTSIKSNIIIMLGDIMDESLNLIDLTTIDGRDESGVPSVANNRIHLTNEVFSGSKNGTTFSVPYNFTADTDIYNGVGVKLNESDKNSTILPLGTAFTFTYNVHTFLYYAKYSDYVNNPRDNSIFKGFNGAQKINGLLNQNEDGVYVIREIDDNGVRDYIVYCDKTAPVYTYTYETYGGESGRNVTFTPEDDGKTFEFSVFQMNSIIDNDLIDNAHTYYVGELLNIKDTTTLKYSMDSGYTGQYINEGVYQLNIIDRSGNKITVYLAITRNSLEDVTNIQTVPNDYFTYSCSRASYDIEKFVLSYNNEVVENISYANELKFTNVGLYTFEVYDKYGYSYSNNITFNRELPEVSWYAFYSLTDESNKDNVYTPIEEIISAGRTDILTLTKVNQNTYYLSTDLFLKFVLASTTLYEYTFIGDVDYTPSTNGDKIEVKINAFKEWSVEIRYIAYPDISIVYSRLGADLSVPVTVLLSSEKPTMGYKKIDTKSSKPDVFATYYYQEIEEDFYPFLSITGLQEWADGVTYYTKLDNSQQYSEVDTNNTIAMPNAANSVLLYVYAVTQPNSDITVKVRTRNKTAISEAGDYIAYDKEIKLTPANYCVRISINTSVVGFNITNSSDKTTIYRTFDTEIYDIKGNGNVDAARDTVECGINGSYNVTYKTNNGNKVFEQYLEGESRSIDSMTLDDDGDSSTQNFNLDSSLITEYILSGLAKYYFTIQDGKYTDYKSVTHSSGQGGSYTSYYYENTGYRTVRLYSTTTGEIFYAERLKVKGSHSGLEHFEYGIGKSKGSLSVTGSTSYGAITLSAKRGNATTGTYYLIPDTNVDGAISVQLSNYDYSSSHDVDGNLVISNGSKVSQSYNYDAYLNNEKLYTFILDNKAPEITGWYLDKTAISAGETLRLSVRFSEPVSLRSNGMQMPSITATGTDGINTYPNITFKYLCGDGTDTMCFEFDPNSYGSGGINITNIKINAFKNSKYIYDYAYNLDRLGNALGDFSANNSLQTYDPEFLGNDMSCNIDSRVPEITVTLQNKTVASKSITVPVTISNISNSGVFEYVWTNSTLTPTTYSYSKSLEEGLTFNITGSDLSGIYYLHLQVKSVFGNVVTRRAGPYYFDNNAPVITDYAVQSPTQSLRQRSFTWSVSDLPNSAASAGISEMYLVYSVYGSTNYIYKQIYPTSAIKNTVVYSDQTKMASLVITAADLGLVEGELDYQYYYMGIYAVDMLSNQPVLSGYTFYSGPVLFDIRSDLIPEVETSIPSFFKAQYGEVYDTSSGLIITYTFNTVENAIGYDIASFVYAGNEINPAEYPNYFSYTTNDGVSIIFEPNAKGFYTFKLVVHFDSEDRYSKTLTFYLTPGTNGDTLNYTNLQGNVNLINKMYILNTNRYYYRDNTSTIGKISAANEYYVKGGAENYPAFSSYDKALEFVKYYEYLDLYAFQLNETIANSLNNGTYKKADGETTTAAAGQWWIRYKRSSWEYSTAESAWEFYFYGANGIVNLNNLSSILVNAINTVSERIASNGYYKYLTSADSLNQDGVPVIDTNRVFPNTLIATSSKSGTAFNTTSPATFNADTNIYSNNVTDAYGKHVLATAYTLQFSTYTELFYAPYIGSMSVTSFIPIANTFTSLRDVIGASGTYILREVDENGIRDFVVYVDCGAPSINISYETKTDSVSMEVDATIDGLTINATSFSVSSISDSEIDEYAYVAIFNRGGVLLNAYLRNELKSQAIYLPVGQYYIEVYDRSGNHYTINVRVSNVELDCKITVVENRSIRFVCNNDAKDIYKYEIYREGVLVTSTFALSTTYKEAGIYRFIVEDFFGNVYDKSVELIRNLPVVTWKYLDTDTNTYLTYESDVIGLTMHQASNNTWYINTNKTLRITYDVSAGYSYSFSGNPSNIKENSSGSTINLTITQQTNWNIKIYYSDFEDVFINYTCVIDFDAPIITASAEEYSLSLMDDLSFALQEQDAQPGDILEANTIAFINGSSYSLSITDGSTVTSNLITILFEDNSLTTYVRVSLNGETIAELTDDAGITSTSVSRYGSYIITARDSLGNEGSFTFTNLIEEGFEYKIDDVDKSAEVNPLQYMTESGGQYIYTKNDYGHDYLEFTYDDDATITILITTPNGEKKYARYNILSGAIYQISKVATTNENGDKILVDSTSSALFSTINGAYKKDEFYNIASKENYFVDIWVKYEVIDNVYSITWRIDPPESEVSTPYVIEARIAWSNVALPFYIKANISSYQSKIVVEGETGVIILDKDKLMNYFSGDFTVAQTNITSEYIEEIKISYSEIAQYDTYQDIYKDGVYTEINNSGEGFYRIEVLNIFGNTTVFTIIVSETLNIIAEAIYADGGSNNYGNSYFEDHIVKSNAQITISAYVDYITVHATKDSEDIDVEITVENRTSSFTVSGNGVYMFVITDAFGNEIVINAKIVSEEVEFNNDYLVGFNEKALKRNENYTNTLVTILAQEMIDEGIQYISYTYEEQEYVLYNKLAQNQIAFDASQFIDVIGSKGNGTYTITITDEYGNKAFGSVVYSNESTLEVYRQTRNTTEEEGIKLSKLSEDIYSNLLVGFRTTSTKYKFTINNLEKDLEATLIFPNEVENGQYVYNITYLDEYGFEYGFDVYLIRRQIEIKYSENMEIVKINSVDTTRDSVAVIFDEGTCTYKKDDGEPNSYTSGTILSRDGIYVFTVSDRAGNTSTATIKKDTMVEFVFKYSGSENAIINGEIVNNNKITFASINSDGATISRAVLNGVAQENIPTTFSEFGTWEFLIVDPIGNTAYFVFYMMTHAVKQYTYVAPYGYKISRLVLKNNIGTEMNYLYNVTQEDDMDKIVMDQSGTYFVEISNAVTSEIKSFSVKIDQEAPQVSLVGAIEGESTTSNVSLSGLTMGDVVYIYKDGKLIKTTTINSTSAKIDDIQDKGEYKIVVVNEAGNETVLTFTRLYTANAATSIIIIVAIIILVVALLVLLLLRKRSKVD